jgi:hypothetical protein
MNSILARISIGVLVVIAVFGFLFSIGSFGGIIPFIGFVVTPITNKGLKDVFLVG